MKNLLTALLLLALTACSATIEHYRGMQPALDLSQFFYGKVSA